MNAIFAGTVKTISMYHEASILKSATLPTVLGLQAFQFRMQANFVLETDIFASASEDV